MRGRKKREADALEELYGQKGKGFLSKLFDKGVKKAVGKMSGAGGFTSFIITGILNKMLNTKKMIPKNISFLSPGMQKKAIKQLEDKNLSDWTGAFEETLGKDISKAIQGMEGDNLKQKTELFYKNLSKTDKKQLLKDYFKSEGMFDHSDELYDFAKDWGGDMMIYKGDDSILDRIKTSRELNIPLPQINQWNKAFKGPQWDDIDIEEIDFDDEGNIISTSDEGKRIFNRLFGPKQAEMSSSFPTPWGDIEASNKEANLYPEEYEEIARMIEDLETNI
jgi:hypothetical protein